MLGNHITQLRNEPDQLKLTILSAKVGASLEVLNGAPVFLLPYPKKHVSIGLWLADPLLMPREARALCSVKCTDFHSLVFGKCWG